MLGKIEDQVDLSPAYLFGTESVSTCTAGGYDLHEVNDVVMLQLLEKLYLSHRCDWKALFVIIHLYHLKSIKFVWIIL